MRFRYDSKSGAMYVRVEEGRIEETLELGGGCYLDVGSDGTVLGLECLSLDEFRALILRNGGELNLPKRVGEADSGSLVRVSVPGYERDLLRRAVESLEPQQQQVLHLRYMDGLATPDVADRLGISISTAHRIQREALSSLRAALRSNDSHLEDEASLEAALLSL